MAGFPNSKANKTPLDRAREPRNNVPLAIYKDKIAAGLTKTYGNITRVADSLGCARFSLRRYIDSDPELKQVLADARERTGDLLEDTAVNQALSGNANMTQFLLKCRYRERGYTFERDNQVDNTLQAAIALIMNRSKSPVDAM